MGARRIIPAQGPGWGREICWCKAQLLMFSPPLQPGKLRLQHQTSTEKPNSPLPGSSRFNASNWLCLAFPGTGAVGVSNSQQLQNPGGNLRGWRRRQQSPLPAWLGRGGGGSGHPAWGGLGDTGTVLLTIRTWLPPPHSSSVLVPV